MIDPPPFVHSRWEQKRDDPFVRQMAINYKKCFLYVYLIKMKNMTVFIFGIFGIFGQRAVHV